MKKRKKIADISPKLESTTMPPKLFAKVAYKTYMVFILSDMCYSILYDITTEMNKHGSDMTQTMKNRFDHFFNSMDMAKRAALGCSIDVNKTLSLDRIDAFVDLSTYMQELFETAYNRAYNFGDVPLKMLSIIKNFPEYTEKMMFEEYVKRHAQK